ncbi:MAG: hypothetical protein H6Q14_856 [Bacteroidetes bacterium]|nr:hypothetical protein [Bacteroidota bacterium]
MKRIVVCVSVVFALFFTSCSSDPENAIIDYLQAKNGMDAKIYDLKEVKEITVADSLAILKSKAEKNLQFKIDSVQQNIDKYKNELSDGAKTILSTPTLRDAYAKVITKGENTLDSLKKVKVSNSDAYNEREQDEVLAIIYSGRLQTKKADLTYFVLSPDGEICFNSLSSYK